MERTAHAKKLFAPLGPTYDRSATVLSFGQDPRWRRFLVSRVEAGPGDTVLDVATGTGAVVLELLRRKGCTVVGVDQSPGMLEVAGRRLPPHVRLVQASAEALPSSRLWPWSLRLQRAGSAGMPELSHLIQSRL